jgi:hypothetical protein
MRHRRVVTVAICFYHELNILVQDHKVAQEAFDGRVPGVAAQHYEAKVTCW